MNKKIRLVRIIALALCICMLENIFEAIGTIVVKAETGEYIGTAETLSGNDAEVESVSENSNTENKDSVIIAENQKNLLETNKYTIYFDITENAFVIEDLSSLLAFRAIINDEPNVEVYDEKGLIEDEERISSLGQNAYMTADIDLKNDKANQWIPIGESLKKPYSGTFEGRGHKVDNINSYKISNGTIGFFAYTKDAEIHDLAVEMDEDAMQKVYGVTYGAVLVGYAIDSKIEACYAYGKILGDERPEYNALEYAGLICGKGESTSIRKCIGEGEVYALQPTGYIGGREAYAGGIIGYNSEGIIENSMAFGDISAKGFYSYAGGICGQNDNGVITKNYYVGNAGALVYRNLGKMDNNYIRSLPSDMNKENILKVRSTYVDWDFENVWEQRAEINDGYPFLKETFLPQGKTKYVHPSVCAYSIKTGSTLIYPQLALNITFDREIDCNKELGIYLENTDTKVKVPCEYECDGNNLRIVSNILQYGETYALTINQSTIYDREQESNYFGGTYNEYVINVAEYLLDGKGTEDNPYLINSPEGLAYMRYELGSHYRLISDINMCEYNNGEWRAIGDEGKAFTGTFDGAGYTISGIKKIKSNRNYIGLFATTQNAEIKNLKVCLAENGVLDYSIQNPGAFSSTAYPYIGILVGAGSGTLEKCYVEGSIDSNQKTYGAGLLAGEFDGIISQCSAKGQNIHTRDSELTFAYSVAGGLIGKFKGQMNDSYCVIDTIYAEAYSGAGDSAYAGGLIGEVEQGEIRNCYVRNSNIKTCISGGSMGSMGAIVGYTGDKTTIENCYYNADILTLENPRNGIAMTTEQMKNSNYYENWNFDNIWKVLPQWNDGYPFLSWMGKNNIVKYYVDPNYNEQIKADIDIWVSYGTLENEALKELPQRVYICIEEGDKKFQTIANLTWKLTGVYNGRPGMGGGISKAYADVVYENEEIVNKYADYLWELKANIYVEEYEYQELLNKYGMYYDDLFRTYPQALAETYSYDSVLNVYVNKSLDAMNSLSKLDTISAALLMGLNSKDALKFVTKEFLYQNAIMVSESTYEEYMDEIVLSIMQECFPTEEKMSGPLAEFSETLKSVQSLNAVSQKAEKILDRYTESLTIHNLLEGLQNSQKTADILVEYTKKGIDEEVYFLTVVEMYTINYIQIEEMKNVAANAGNKELYYTLNRMQDRMIDNPASYVYEHLITEQITSMMIDETLSVLNAMMSPGMQGAYKIYKIAYKAVNSAYKYIKPDVDTIVKVIIADNMFQTCSSLVDRYQINFMKAENITVNEIQEYEIAYKMMLASLKVWMNTAADVYGKLGAEQLEWLTPENSAKKKNLQELAATILKDGEVDYLNYIDHCMKAAVLYSDRRTISTPVFNGEEEGVGMRRVSVLCDEPDVTIYYTLDGTLPTSKKGYYERYNCWIYTNPILVAPGQMFKVRAYKEGMIASDVTTYMISEDEYWKQVEKNIQNRRNTNLNLKGYSHYDIPSDLLKRLKENNLNVEIEYDNYSWIIESKKISVIKDVSLKAEKKYFMDVINDALYEDGINGNVKSVGLHLAYDGEFGFEGILKYYMGIKYTGKEARLYYYNDREGKYDKNYQQTIIDDNGYAKFKFRHASDYMIIYDATENNRDSSNDIINNTFTENANIIYGIVSGQKSMLQNSCGKEIAQEKGGMIVSVQDEKKEEEQSENNIQREEPIENVTNNGVPKPDMDPKDDKRLILLIIIIIGCLAVLGCCLVKAFRKIVKGRVLSDGKT